MRLAGSRESIGGTVKNLRFRSGRQIQQVGGTEMIRASVEVIGTNSAFHLEVYAKNLQRAVDFAANRYPGYSVSVRFPLDPEVFFVERADDVGSEMVELCAAKGSQQERGRDEAAGAPAARRRWGSTVGTTSGLFIRERAAS